MSIGLFNESGLHGDLKRYIEPDERYHELEYKGYIVDILSQDGVTEIQTASFGSIKKKLADLLCHTKVTVAYPVMAVKRIYWQDPDTGEMTGGRLSSKKATLCDVFRELRWIKGLVAHEHLRLRIIPVEAEFYNRLNGYGKDRKKRASRIDKTLIKVIDDMILFPKEELHRLLPLTLPEEFTSKDLAKEGKISQSVASYAMKTLCDLSLAEHVSNRGRMYVYRVKK
ncbi:MAG: hypothetical protein GX633_05355 [Clostridiales bacterium]|nr:hypothetical protein [Clostridiales bacterium]